MEAKFLTHTYSPEDFLKVAIKERSQIAPDLFARLTYKGDHFIVVPLSFIDESHGFKQKTLHGLTRPLGGKAARASINMNVSEKQFLKDFDDLKKREYFGLSFEEGDPIIFLHQEDYDQLVINKTRKASRAAKRGDVMSPQAVKAEEGHPEKKAGAVMEEPNPSEVKEPDGATLRTSGAFSVLASLLTTPSLLGEKDAAPDAPTLPIKIPEAVSEDVPAPVDAPPVNKPFITRMSPTLDANGRVKSPFSSGLLKHNGRLIGAILSQDDFDLIDPEEQDWEVLGAWEALITSSNHKDKIAEPFAYEIMGPRDDGDDYVILVSLGYIDLHREKFARIMEEGVLDDVRDAHCHHLRSVLYDYWSARNPFQMTDFAHQAYDIIRSFCGEGRGSEFQLRGDDVVALCSHDGTIKAYMVEGALPKDAALKKITVNSLPAFTNALKAINISSDFNTAIEWAIGNKVVSFIPPISHAIHINHIAARGPDIAHMVAVTMRERSMRAARRDAQAQQRRAVAPRSVETSDGRRGTIPPKPVEKRAPTPQSVAKRDDVAVPAENAPSPKSAADVPVPPPPVQDGEKPDVAARPVEKAAPKVVDATPQPAPAAASATSPNSAGQLAVLRQIAAVTKMLKELKSAQEQIIQAELAGNHVTLFNAEVTAKSLTPEAIALFPDIYGELKDDGDPPLDYDVVEFIGDLPQRAGLLQAAFKKTADGKKLVMLTSEEGAIMIGQNKTFVDMIRVLSIGLE